MFYDSVIIRSTCYYFLFARVSVSNSYLAKKSRGIEKYAILSKISWYVFFYRKCINFIYIFQPKVVTATDEAELVKQMERAELENAEVAGDDDEDEDEEEGQIYSENEDKDDKEDEDDWNTLKNLFAWYFQIFMFLINSYSIIFYNCNKLCDCS